MTTEQLTKYLRASKQAEEAQDEVLPDFITVSQIVEVSEGKFSKRTVRKHLKTNKLDTKVGNEIFVLRDTLRQGWPDVYHLLLKKAQIGREYLVDNEIETAADEN